MQFRTWPKRAPGSILKKSSFSYIGQMWDSSLLPKISGKWKLCATSVQTTVSYKTLMCSANCLYVVLYTNLNMQCLRHTAWSKGMPEYYWSHDFDCQLWRLICMSLPFFSSFVPIPHFKMWAKGIKPFFSLKQRYLSLDHWEGKWQVLWVSLPLRHMKKKGFRSSSHSSRACFKLF